MTLIGLIVLMQVIFSTLDSHHTLGSERSASYILQDDARNSHFRFALTKYYVISNDTTPQDPLAKRLSCTYVQSSANCHGD